MHQLNIGRLSSLTSDAIHFRIAVRFGARTRRQIAGHRDPSVLVGVYRLAEVDGVFEFLLENDLQYINIFLVNYFGDC